jgi:hypothetical protein
MSSGAGPVVNDQQLLFDGGNGVNGNASSGRSITLIGTSVQNSALIHTVGGNSTTGQGGDGGNIALISTAGTTTNTGTFQSDGGTGGASTRRTLAGVVTIDGANLPP